MAGKVIVITTVAVLAALLVGSGVFFLTNKGKAVVTDPRRASFEAYKTKNNLSFTADEDTTRFAVFCHSLEVIAEHNARQSDYELGLTPFSHFTHEEFSSMLGFKGQAQTEEVVYEDDDDQHQTTLDWVAKGAVTPIKNQGQCGSCWSFSTTGSLEGLKFINGDHVLTSLSEQQLVDCSGSYGNQGCNGGLMDYAFKYVAAKGITTEAAYPYTAKNGKCKKNLKIAFKNKGHTDIKKSNNNALIAAITKQPVSVAIEADQEVFQYYTKGVIHGSACGTQLDHGVLAVGYGTMNGRSYIKVKNSWGASWGQKGYVYLAQAKGLGTCGINSTPSVPTL